MTKKELIRFLKEKLLKSGIQNIMLVIIVFIRSQTNTIS